MLRYFTSREMAVGPWAIPGPIRARGEGVVTASEVLAMHEAIYPDEQLIECSEKHAVEFF